MRLRYFVTALLVVVAAVWAAAQSVAVDKVAPTILAGENVGFRVEGLRGGATPVGRIVVKVNGQWVEAELATVNGVTSPLSQR